MSYRNVIGASLFALGIAVAAPSLAATADKPAAKADASAAAHTETAKFTDAKLASFAAARKKVAVLNRQYEGRIGAADQTAKRQVVQLKNIDLAAAVKSEGLTTQEYNEIFLAMKADPALAARIATVKTAAAARPSATRIQ